MQAKLKAFLNCNRQKELKDLYETNFKSDWQNIPDFVTKINLKLSPNRDSTEDSNVSKDDSDGIATLSAPTAVTFNILHMVIILRKNKILRLILEKMHEDTIVVLLNNVKINKTNNGKDLEKSWIFSANSLHLAAKYNPEALHMILSHLKNAPMALEEKFSGLHGVTPLHVAAMNSDSMSAR